MEHLTGVLDVGKTELSGSGTLDWNEVRNVRTGLLDATDYWDEEGVGVCVVGKDG